MRYTKEQINFLLKHYYASLPLKEITERFNKKFETDKSYETIEVTIRRNRDVVRDVRNVRDEVLKAFTEYVKEHKYIPKTTHFAREYNFSKSEIRYYFPTDAELEEAARKLSPKTFEDLTDSSLFTEESFTELEEDIACFNRFVITTAVTGCAVHKKGLAALQTFCDANNAKLLVLPCSDPAKTKTHKNKMALSHEIPNDCVVFRDVFLNNSLVVSTIKLSAKQILPLTGLKRMGLRGSCILASPKQILEHVANSNRKGIPRALMTTGAITVSDYRTDRYMSERTAYIAEQDHKLGAVIVELDGDDIFYARRIEIDERTGTFYDINKKYHPSGKITKSNVEVLNQPDWHTLSTDPEFREIAKEVTKAVNPEIMTFEDFFDGCSINPHERNNVVLRAKKSSRGEYLLSDELKACQAEINDILTWGDFKVLFKYGNHEDFLKRWLSGAEYSSDAPNHYEGVCLAKALLEDWLPFEYAMRKRYPINEPDRVEFLGVNDSYVVNGVEQGVHGHLGSGGRRSPGMAGLEAYGVCTTGHTHSAAILRNVVRVGTATKLELEYNDGASSWTQTLCLQHKDGARQLITVIEGNWCLPDILEDVTKS